MKKLHLICNSHIDPVWQWEWEEGAAATLSTFQSAVNLADEFDYIFCHNEAILYKYIEQYAPALFEKIRNLVQVGKWHIMGGWYLQPDCLMPDGEGIVRQIREGEIYFKEKFGVMPATAIGFDAFGHSRGLVQIIKKCGQDSYLFVRPYSEYMGTYKQLDLPNECFLWKGYDGSVIKAQRISGYNSALGHSCDKIKKDIRDSEKDEIAVSAWGVGNHGGGPSRKDLADIKDLIEKSDFTIVHSTPENYFSEVNPEKIFDRSLISCMPGCYTSMIGVKQKYREMERELFFVEKMMSVASLKGLIEYDNDKLKEVVEDMLSVQFHDMLPGTTIKNGEENALNYIRHADLILNKLRADCFFNLCKGQTAAEENTYPILVFNPKTYGGEQTIECELSIIPTLYFNKVFSEISVFDEKGNRLVSQTIKEGSNLSVDWRKKVVFIGNLSPLGITRFTARTEKKARKQYPVNKSLIFDNGVKSVFINARTGLIESYKVNGKEYAEGKLFRPFCYEDNADPWGMSKEQTLKEIGKKPKPFKLLKNPDGEFCGLSSFEIIEDGDVYIGAEAFFGYGNSRLRIGYKVYKQGDAVDIDVNLFPAEINKIIKLHTPIKTEKLLGDEMFGTEELYSNGKECIARDFIAAKSGAKYVQIITPSTYGCSYKDGNIRITLHRSVAYCAHPIGKRPLLQKNIYIPRVDCKECDYKFRLCVTDETTLQKNAAEFTETPYAINVFPTIDDSTDNGMQIFTDNPDVRVVTIKKSEQTNGYVFRLFNNSSIKTQTVLSCGTEKIKLDFNEYQVKTVIYSDDKLSESEEMII